MCLFSSPQAAPPDGGLAVRRQLRKALCTDEGERRLVSIVRPNRRENTQVPASALTHLNVFMLNTAEGFLLETIRGFGRICSLWTATLSLGLRHCFFQLETLRALIVRSGRSHEAYEIIKASSRNIQMWFRIVVDEVNHPGKAATSKSDLAKKAAMKNAIAIILL